MNDDSTTISSSVPVPTLVGVTELFVEAWEIYKERFTLFAAIPLVFVVLMVVLGGAVAGAITLYPQLLLSVFVDPRVGSLSVGLIAIGCVLLIAMIIVYTWMYSSLLYAVTHHHEPMGTQEAYRQGWRYILSYWWIGLLASGVIIGGTFLFIVPGVVFLVWFSFAVYVLFAENVRGRQALLRSREYVRGFWGAACLRLLFMSLCSMLVSVVVGGVFNALKVGFLQHVFVMIFWMPLTLTYGYRLYVSLKTARGHVSIEHASYAPFWLALAGIIVPLAVIIILLT